MATKVIRKCKTQLLALIEAVTAQQALVNARREE